MSRGRKLALAVTAVVVLGGSAAVLLLQSRNRAPSAAAVRAEVERRLGGPPLRVVNVDATVNPTEPGHADVELRAEAEVAEPLYETADATTLLRDELKLDASAWLQARKVLAGQTAPRILELAGLKGLDDRLLRDAFIHQVTAGGTRLGYSGHLTATRGERGWDFDGGPLTRTSGSLQGRPRATFGSATAVVDDPADLKQLHALAAAQADLPAKVEAGRRAFLKERQAEQEKVVAQLLATITPGTLYAGTLTAAGAAPVKVFLEFTDVDPRARQVKAALRNDGSWTDQRALAGGYTFDPDDETLTLALESPARDAVPEAGPLLSTREPLRLAFKLNAGHLAAQDGQGELALARLGENEAAATRRSIAADEQALREATRPGRVYRAAIRSREGHQTFDSLLRFIPAGNDGNALAATLEPTGREAWPRPFRGRLQANRYQSAGAPVQLETQAADAQAAADKASPAGLKRKGLLALRLHDGHLQGESDDFSFDFAPLSAGEIAQLAAAAAQREQALLAVVKAETAYPGTARLTGKSTTEKVRLRFRRVGPHGSDVDAAIESLERPGVFRDLRGTLDPVEQRLVLTVTGRGRTGAGHRAGLMFPPFVRSTGELVLNLRVAASGLEGDLSHEGWTVEFPAAGAVAVTGNAAGDYPTAPGAYVWLDGAWQPLPRNHGKVTKSALQVLGGLFSALSKSSSSATGEKIAELTFTGQDPVPTVPGNGVIVIYVGPIRSENAERYPALRDYPAIELAPTTRDSDGSRHVSLTRIAANVPVGGFREHRVAAELDQIDDGLLELSSTRPLAPGSYAVLVNEEMFELAVE